MSEFIWLYRGTSLLIATVVLAALAVLRGAGPERATVAILAAIPLADRINHFIDSGGSSIVSGSDYWTVDLGHFFIDGFALLFLVTVGLRANRIYPLWIAGIQIIAMLSHFSRELSPYIHPTAYAVINRAPYYLQFMIFLLGLIMHIRRAKKIGNYRSWRTSSNSLQHRTRIN